MALSLQLAQAGLKADSLETSCTVTLEQKDGGFAITESHLQLKAKVPGASAWKPSHQATKAAKSWMSRIQTLQHHDYPGCSAGRVAGFPVRINHAALRELTRAKPAAAQSTMRNPATKASLMAWRPRGSVVAASASFGR